MGLDLVRVWNWSFVGVRVWNWVGLGSGIGKEKK